MGEVINFEERRKKFMQGIQLTGTDKVSYIGDRTRFINDTPERRRNRRALERAAEKYFSLSPEERLEVQRKSMKAEERRKGRRVTGARSSGNYKGSRKALNLLLVGFIGAAIAVGAYGIASNNSKAAETQDRVPLEQVIGNQDELARLGISNETATEIQNLYSELNSADIENLSEKDVLSLGSRVEDIQLATMKEKISNEMEVPVESIELRVSYTDHVPKASAIIDGKGYNEGDFLDHNNNISSEMADYIEKIAGTQSTNSRLEEGSITKQDALEQYRGAMEGVRDVSTKEFSIDENGNMRLSQVSRADIDKAMEDEER